MLVQAIDAKWMAVAKDISSVQVPLEREIPMTNEQYGLLFSSFFIFYSFPRVRETCQVGRVLAEARWWQLPI